jgi:hypothetical protein
VWCSRISSGVENWRFPVGLFLNFPRPIVSRDKSQKVRVIPAQKPIRWEATFGRQAVLLADDFFPFMVVLFGWTELHSLVPWGKRLKEPYICSNSLRRGVEGKFYRVTDRMWERETERQREGHSTFWVTGSNSDYDSLRFWPACF